MNTVMQRSSPHAGAYRESEPQSWNIMGVGLIAAAFTLATALIFFL
ncbi:hypothetical protein [Komagataeibacter medellinensis]|nr:hypothetical protein [Komagataeibacter medellinensis]